MRTESPAPGGSPRPPRDTPHGKKVDQYIQRVLGRSRPGGKLPSPEEVDSIAAEFCMKDLDLAAAGRAARGHLERGLEHCRRRRWDGAIEELTAAAALAPREVAAAKSLAVAYKERWALAGNPADRAAASALCWRCLDLAPQHAGVYELLAELEQAPGRAASTPRGGRGSLLRLAAVVALGGLAVAGGSVAWRWLQGTVGLVARQTSGVRSGTGRVVEVVADRGWQPTSIVVEPADTVHVGYLTGEINDGTTRMQDAAGSGAACARPPCCAPLPEAPAGALIGRVGDQVFPIGNDGRFAAPGGGPLQLRINECDEDLGDNSGSLVVKVRIEGEDAP